ncbi:MAG: ATP:cob(I)alamin adenosyltransferase [Candidatus Lloydbacteria bacterium CG22_combo_CG10-13_8_21_14_all_47_15]|uniref:Corrinoid adenosyltransferase n=1 Tax=Candidatus Lloydbacteria bacterium CG22_combo_CG10-13_8_21_14_all_47_15 TaxID=1974635 RepID=A0A2H0CV07_9BACT|nr:MAG: ATP:cob(I)alamin adenosyltransferase [Candidatus Lloydbacteria bacterium CG22_combo_CG10-13_8_21_14_all_47_15]
MLYTGKGDNGTTKLFGCDQQFSKSAHVVEALGTLDELNSFLGICKTNIGIGSDTAARIQEIQHTLFSVQAEVAGSSKAIDDERVSEMEQVINNIEKTLPPITSFFLSGGTELAAHFDFARTLARRAERRVVAAREAGEISVTDVTLAYLNRLSSFLYALARQENKNRGMVEMPPHY